MDNRNKRGLALDLKSPDAHKVLERLVKWADVLIVNTPHPARKRLKLSYEDVSSWNSRLIYADITGYGDNGPDADLPGFDFTAYWARSGLLALTRDAGAPPTFPVGGSGDHATAVGLFSAIVMGLYQRERTGKGSYVTTSLLAEGVWATGMMNSAALCDARFFPLHDRKNPPNATINLYRTADDQWLILGTTPDKLAGAGQGNRSRRPAVGPAVQRRHEVGGQHGPAYGHSRRSVQRPADGPLARRLGAGPHHVQRRDGTGRGRQGPPAPRNDIVVPIEGAGGKLTFTISSPIQMHGVAKVPARRTRKSANTTKRFSNSSGSVLPKSRASVRAVPSRVSSIRK